MSDPRTKLSAQLFLYHELVKDDPHTPGRYADLVEQAALALGTGDEEEIQTLFADYRALDEESLLTAKGAFTALYRQLQSEGVEEEQLEGVNLLLEGALIEIDRRGIAA